MGLSGMRAARALCAFLLLGMATAGWEEDTLDREYSREDFPRDFVFGSGTSAYQVSPPKPLKELCYNESGEDGFEQAGPVGTQVEGAAAEDGRTPSVWDTAAHAGKVVDKTTGDIACDGYHKYKDDVKLMKEIGLEAYRLSMSWSRLLPNGRGLINQKGLEYYNNLINELISHGIQPHVTLFHYDLPQVLEDEYKGWLSPKIVDDFTAYADVCFKEFGDRVSHWTTLNEPNALALGGYDMGIFPPFKCSMPFGSNCSAGDSTLEPYIVAHHCLLAHAAVASLYKTKYQAKQQGLIGLNIFVYYFLPLTSSARDINATQRAQDFYTGWFMEPLVNGDYPTTMKERTGSKMPSFSVLQRKQIMGSFDFLGVNHYATLWVSDDSTHNVTTYQRDFFDDLSIKITVKSNVKSRELAFPVTPYGMQGALEHFKHVYGNPPIYIHENGYPMQHNSSLEDAPRVNYLEAYIGSLLDAVRNGSNTRGYFTWSFLDVFELADGYRSSYGLYHVDFEHKDLTRSPKLSAHWYSRFLKGKTDNAINMGNFSDPSRASDSSK